MHFSELRWMEIRSDAALKPCSGQRSVLNNFTGASAATVIRLSLSEAASQHVCPVFPPIDLQHTVYNFCYKSSADYKLYKP